jgi:tRNA(Ile)-lysidine synthetase-like protein
MDDQAETVLMNLARGAGPRGLAGIPVVNGRIIRPLLGVRRAEVEGYLAERGRYYVTDATNMSLDYTRNRVRHVVIPALVEHVNPKAVENIARAAARLAEDEPGLAARGLRSLFPNEDMTEGKLREILAALKKQPAPVEKPCRRAVKCAMVSEQVEMRSWLPGDRITLARGDGSTFTKKLQDIFTDDKIPREKRDSVPVLATATEVVAILSDNPRVAAKYLPRAGEPCNTYIY